MKVTKRVLSWLLVICTILSMVPAIALTASAATYTKTDSIAIGDTVILVCETAKDGKSELSGISTTSSKYGLGTVFSDSPAGLMPLQVVAGANSGTYAFKTSDGKYLTWTSGNSLNVNATLSANTSWNVSIAADGEATITNAAASAAGGLRMLQWNMSSPRFACYDNDGQTAIQLYKVGGTVSGGGSGDSGDEGDDEGTTSELTAKIKIITGEGEAYLSLDGGTTRYGEAATVKGAVATITDVTAGEEMTLVIKAKEGYRVACVEKSSDRLDPADYAYDATLGAYTYTFTIHATPSLNYFRITFLPRISDGGYTAEQITGWDETDASGLYVITGLSGDETYENNAHNVTTTYLMYADNDIACSAENPEAPKAEDYETIGRKSAALQLGAIGVSLNPTAPYLMSGLNTAHLMMFEKYGNTGYYTIRLYGATSDNWYICARSTTSKDKFIYASNTLTDNNGVLNSYALWNISYIDKGAVRIENVGWSDAGATRYLMFNKSLQFRTYTGETEDISYPVLYGATQSNIKVTYAASPSNAGTIKALTAAGAAVASGSFQNKGTAITFNFTPAAGYRLKNVTVNGTDVTVSGNSYTATAMNTNIDLVAYFEPLPAVTFTVQYLLNGTVKKTETPSAQAFYVVNANFDVTHEGKTFKLSEFPFDGIVNGTTKYSDLNAAVAVKAGDVVKVNFSTTEVLRTKTAIETTVGSATSPHTNGGQGTLGFENWYSDINGQDVNGNIKQTFHVELNVRSNDMIEEVREGGNTDVILVLDHSNSMYPPQTNNATYMRKAVEEFSNKVFANNNEGNNRIAVVMYDSQAYAWNGSKKIAYAYSWDTGLNNSAYSTLTYNNCYMNTKAKVLAAYDGVMTEPDLNYTLQGMTNTMGGLRMTDLMAQVRGKNSAIGGKNTTRNLVIVMFTDGLPTARYATGAQDWYSDSNGMRTSAAEYFRALVAGQDLRKTVDSYTKCDSTIYNVALLNDTVNIVAEDVKMARLFLGTSGVYQWNENLSDWDWNNASSLYTDIRSYVKTHTDNQNSSKYFVKSTAWADYYEEIVGTIDDTTMAELYKNIAVKFVAEQYVEGTLTDIIPAGFTLTEASKQALNTAGWKITPNADGSTTISKQKVRADKDGETLSYDLIYNGDGYGAVYTNTEAKYDYTTLGENGTAQTAYFPMPTATVIPWTVNDRIMSQPNTPTTIPVLENDLFEELTQGGYTLSNFTITLTDANGNPTVYNDAIEQVGCGFDAVVDPLSNTIVFYTEDGGASTFYYVVSAVATAPNGTQTTVYSRATQVDVLVSETGKHAQEVTNANNLPEGVTRKTDDHGNVQQLYLVTLTVNMFDIKNGKIVDEIPADFEFVAFKQQAGTSCTVSDNVITCTGITCGSVAEEIVLSYYLRYIGGGYGVIPTNTKATISYQPSDATGNEGFVEKDFPVPYAGVNPHTINDVDIAEVGKEYTIDVMANDLFEVPEGTPDGYFITPVNIYLTDENGNPLTGAKYNPEDDSRTYVIDGTTVTIHKDGTITYTTDGEGPTQFYYVVEATVSVPGGSTYADDNSTTLVSRPTQVTIYSVEDLFILVDFGLKTKAVDFIDYSGIKVGEKQENGVMKDVMLEELLEIAAFGKTPYGELTQDPDNGQLVFEPTTTNFDKVAEYSTPLTMGASVYNNNNAKTIKVDFNVIPANNIYFEESFIEFDSAWVDLEGRTTSGEGGVVTTEGEQQAGEYHNMALHGFDDVYQVRNPYSEGNTKAVTVHMDDYEHTGWFTYSGTGFDIIGSTNATSGVIVAQVYRYDPAKKDAEYGQNDLVKNILVDTWLDGNRSFEQIPVIMFRNTDKEGNPVYGTYRVKVRAFYNAAFDHKYNKIYSGIASGEHVLAAKVGETYYAMKDDGTAIPITVQENGKVAEAAAAAVATTFTFEPDGYTIGNLTYTGPDGMTGRYWHLTPNEDAFTICGARDESKVLGYNASTNTFAVGAPDTNLYILQIEKPEAEEKSVKAVKTVNGLDEAAIRELLGFGANEPLEICTIDTTNARPTKGLTPETKAGQYNVYIDALRIYNPMNTAADTEGDEPEEEEPEVSTEITTGEYVLAANVNGTYYAMGNTFSSKINGTEITVTDGKVAAADAEGFKVTLTKTDNGYTISNGTKYLSYASSANLNGITGTYYWQLAEGVKGTHRLIASSTLGTTSIRALIFRTKTYYYFGAYAVGLAKEGQEEYFDIEILPIEQPAQEEPEEEVKFDPIAVYAAAGELNPTFSNINDYLLDQTMWRDNPNISSLSNGKYVFAVLNSEKYYAMPNNISTTPGTVTAKTITVIGNSVTENGGANYAMTLNSTANGYTITNANGAYLTASDDKLCVSTTAFYWSISEGTNGSFRISPKNNSALALVCLKSGTSRTFVLRDASTVTEGSTSLYDLELLSVSAVDGMLYYATGNKNTDSEEGAVYSGTYLSASGILNTTVDASGRLQLRDTDGLPIKYNNQVVYVELAEDSTVADSKTSKFYYLSGTTKIYLSAGEVEALGVAYYDNRYEADGPENEVYLKNNHGIAMVVDKNTSVHISMKVPYGEGYVMLQAWDPMRSVWVEVANVNSRTEMYYKLETDYIAADGLLLVRCMISHNNTAEANNTVLSLCNVKTAGSSPVATGGLRPMKYAQIVRALNIFETNAEHPTHSFSEWTVETEATCSANGTEIRSCECGMYETREIPATGHIYADGACACGKEISVNKALDFTMNVTLGAEMKTVYTVLASTVADYEDLYLVVDRDGERTVYGFDRDMIDFDIKGNEATGEAFLYSADYIGIHAKKMGDDFTATLYAVDAEGNVFCSESKTESMKSFLMERFNAPTATAAQKTMYVDMLNYGAAVQTYLNYKTDRLVNADLTAEHLAFATKTEPAAKDAAAVTGEGEDLSANVTLLSKVTLTITTRYTAKADSDLYFVIRDAKTNEEIAKVSAEAYNEIMLAGVYDNIGAKQMRNLITVTLYDGEEAVSKTITWSVESFVAQVRASGDAARTAMVNAMLTYGDAVAAYMAEA